MLSFLHVKSIALESQLTFHIIDSEKTDSYVNREAGKKMTFVIMGFCLVGLLLFGLTYHSPAIRSILFLPLLLMFSLLSLVIYLAATRSIRNHIKAVEFSVDTTGVSILLRKDELSVLTKTSMTLNEIRYGKKFVETILINHIRQTRIKKNEIIFCSIDENFLNGNGVIKIPKEIEGYQEIVSLVQQNKALFKLQEAS